MNTRSAPNEPVVTVTTNCPMNHPSTASLNPCKTHHFRTAQRTSFIGVAAALAFAAASASGQNLITNGSFEAAGTTGVNSFTGWQKENIPSNSPASVIAYNSTAAYPNSAFGESVTPDNNALSASPDPVGTRGAYLVGDFSQNETIFQHTYLTPGNYRLGFSSYLTANGLANANNSRISVQIIGIPVASTNITGSSIGRTWTNNSGVGSISVAGYYKTALVFNSNGNPAKDVVIDRVYALRTNDPATITIPGTPSFVPEPSSALLLMGGLTAFGLIRRRTRTA